MDPGLSRLQVVDVVDPNPRHVECISSVRLLTSLCTWEITVEGTLDSSHQSCEGEHTRTTACANELCSWEEDAKTNSRAHAQLALPDKAESTIIAGAAGCTVGITTERSLRELISAHVHNHVSIACAIDSNQGRDYNYIISINCCVHAVESQRQMTIPMGPVRWPLDAEGKPTRIRLQRRL